MAIAKDEIEKYIFDPENPKKCKSYKLLLRIAKKENVAFFSPYFLQYFLGQGLLDGKFKEELWDIPKEYDYLTIDEKFKLFEENHSRMDLEEFIKDAELINTDKLTKYKFYNDWTYPEFQKLVDGSIRGIFKTSFIESLSEYVNSSFLLLDSKIQKVDHAFLTSGENKNKNFLFFSLNYLEPIITNVNRTTYFWENMARKETWAEISKRKLAHYPMCKLCEARKATQLHHGIL